MAEIRPFAFVLMPFSKDFDDIYQLGIKECCNTVGFVAERVDEQIYSETILERIYRQIKVADIVIADMTNRNANVFYEVGYAHALGKPCILLTQNADDIPFDLKHHRHIVYEGSIGTLKERLEGELSWHMQQIEENKTKKLLVNIKSTVGFLTKTSYAARGKVDIEIDIQNVSGEKIREIEAIYLHTGKLWDFSQDQNKCSKSKSSLDDYALRHFIKPATPSLSPNTWAPISITGKKTLATAYDGEVLKDSYHLVGHVTLEIVTDSGSYRERLDLDVEVDELPF
jgi:nucleoside 2-deoxyribosyltransferase